MIRVNKESGYNVNPFPEVPVPNGSRAG